MMIQNTATRSAFVFILIIPFLLSSCAPAATPESPTPVPPTATVLPTEVPTATVTPMPTSTNTPEPTQGPTPLPGEELAPVTSFANSIPWLPLVSGKEPMTVYYGFNTTKAPFDNVLVRQAFAAAVDRAQIAEQASKLKFRNVTPATSLTPSETIGRNLYKEVGIPYDPARAKELLEEAGYPNGAGFPEVTLIVSKRGSVASAYTKMAESIVAMWDTNLGVKVDIEVVGNMDMYLNRLRTDLPDIYQLGWGADQNDPDNFLNTLFSSTSEMNFGHFNNLEFDFLVFRAAKITDPLERQLLYIQAEQILTELDAAVIPLYHTLFY